jgi:hypothetical protein
MATIRKFAYAALLAVTTLNFAPSPASAQEAARGRFTLTHAVLWGNAKVPAGDYEFSYDPNHVSPVLSLTKRSGERAGFIVLVPATDSSKPSGANRLVLESSTAGSYVSAMDLPQFGMTLHFKAPAHSAEKQLAKAGTSAAASDQ